MKRFYKTVDVAAVDAGWDVRLDGRPVRSPAKAPLSFASDSRAPREESVVATMRRAASSAP